MSWEAVDLAEFDRAGRYKLLTGSVIPRPIAWVTTRMPDGRTNLAP
jgi:flavin reductase (DIM6/NTAB) family NADH-FMN oxidoreductase RutF